jgi:hypothetical protein
LAVGEAVSRAQRHHPLAALAEEVERSTTAHRQAPQEPQARGTLVVQANTPCQTVDQVVVVGPVAPVVTAATLELGMAARESSPRSQGATTVVVVVVDLTAEDR